MTWTNKKLPPDIAEAARRHALKHAAAMKDALSRNACELGYPCPQGPHGVCCGEPREARDG